METTVLRSKALFNRRWEAGIFGNKPIVWNTLVELEASGYFGKVAIRYRGRASHGPFHAGLSIGEAGELFGRLVAEGYASEDLYLYEDLPTDHILVNGEICWCGPILNLVYSTVPKRMRDSFAEGKVAVSGLNARLILRRYLEPEDREHLDELLDRYPEHAIEFTGYSRRIGTLGRKMVIWEVRHY